MRWCEAGTDLKELAGVVGQHWSYFSSSGGEQGAGWGGNWIWGRLGWAWGGGELDLCKVGWALDLGW